LIDWLKTQPRHDSTNSAADPSPGCASATGAYSSNSTIKHAPSSYTTSSPADAPTTGERTSARGEKEVGCIPATPPGARQTHSRWACRPFVTLQARLRSRVTSFGRRTSSRAWHGSFVGAHGLGSQETLPAGGSETRRVSAVRPAASQGRERERERERDAPMPVHLPTGLSDRAAVPSTSVKYDSTRKHSLITSDPIPSRLNPETGSCRSATTENPKPDLFFVVTGPLPGDLTTRTIHTPEGSSQVPNVKSSCVRVKRAWQSQKLGTSLARVVRSKEPRGSRLRAIAPTRARSAQRRVKPSSSATVAWSSSREANAISCFSGSASAGTVSEATARCQASRVLRACRRVSSSALSST
jgi:hypothetical protein